MPKLSDALLHLRELVIQKRRYVELHHHTDGSEPSNMYDYDETVADYNEDIAEAAEAVVDASVD